VRVREVFYLSGYDPRGARHYYNLYKRESQKEAKKGEIYRLSKREKTGPHRSSFWIEKGKRRTRYHFLEWDDLIRKRWEKSWIDFVADLYHILRSYLFNGAIVRYARTSPVQMIAAFYPVLYLLFTFLLALGLFRWSISSFSPTVGWFVAGALGGVLGAAVVFLAIKIAKKLAVFWLLRIYKFSSEYIELPNEDLKDRIKIFADEIAEAIDRVQRGETDEILIVSHSVGTILTIPILAELRRRVGNENESWSRVYVMTLGECIPVVSFHPEAGEYREQMRRALEGSPITWLDFTTPIDGACFPLLDFYETSGVKVPPERKPRYLSPRFHTLFTPEGYRRIKKNRYLTHFIYLLSTELEGPYNYFRLTAGEEPLERYTSSFKGGEK